MWCKSQDAGSFVIPSVLWSSQDSVDPLLWAFRSGFEGLGADASEMLMTPRAIVERFDVVGHVYIGELAQPKHSSASHSAVSPFLEVGFCGVHSTS